VFISQPLGKILFNRGGALEIYKINQMFDFT